MNQHAVKTKVLCSFFIVFTATPKYGEANISVTFFYLFAELYYIAINL